MKDAMNNYKNINLLDCTLRDGGYVNDWNFGHDNLMSVFERLVASKVDIIEVGFLDERRPYDFNRSIFPDTESIKKIFQNASLKPPMVVGMIDFGTCDISNLQPCSESFIDGIRVIFKKQKMHAAMEFCRQVKALGYKVFSQLVSITAYENSDLDELIELVNDVEPYAVSMVDTYGLLNPSSLLEYYNYLDEHVNPNINIGFHAHNNFQLGYANCIAFLSKPTKRNIVVDGTLYGMGKSAGNAPLELVAMHLNQNYGKAYDLKPMLESIEESIKPFFFRTPWGYKTLFFLSAQNECHPNYVDYFLKKENLSISSIEELLSKIEPKDRKLLYDKDYAESLYQSYIKQHTNDASVFAKIGKELEGKDILLVGPGQNIRLQKSLVDEFCKKHDCFVISINYLPDFLKTDCVFITKINRYRQIDNPAFSKVKVIATTNVSPKDKNFDYVINRENLLEPKESIKDNSFLMLLKVLLSSGVKSVYCAGFDGYSDKEDNYFIPEMEYDFVKQIAVHLNSHIRDVVNAYRKSMTIKFITFSQYDHEEDVNSATF
ncbi:MAG: aldolase catalytic domain-containing protein [Succinivibrio sp.]|nr:aldolase catalytic domain-containing protein [Succinivibrio sp.]